MSAASSAEWRTDPFRSGTPEQFARLRALLRRAGYTEPGLCARFEIRAMQDYWSAREARPELPGPNDAQAVLVRLFLDAEDVSRADLHATLGDDVATIEALGLLEAGIAPDTVTGTVLLYPTEHLWIVSDRNVGGTEGGIEAPPPADVVYPAIAQNTQRFVALMPRTPVERCLELCSGTGIAALLAATSFAQHAWAVDITERATRFARFNAMLNDARNCTVLQGDVYAPLGEQSFDRIVAHPPYMPALEDEYFFRDGGEDGERVTWRILSGLADHLCVGGDFYCECLISDRARAPIEKRVREALGPGGDAFDVLVGEIQRRDAEEYYRDLVHQGQIDGSLLDRQLDVFRRLGIELMVFGVIVIRRGGASHSGVTIRRSLDANVTTEALFEMLGPPPRVS